MALPVMTQAELSVELAEMTGGSRAEAKAFLAALTDIIESNLGECVRTRFSGITIEPKLRAATKKRMGRNPQTGEEVPISAKPATVRVVARVQKALKEKAPSVKKLNANL